MAKNITLKLDDAVLQECKKRAFIEEKSVSQWVSDMIIANLSRKATFESSKKYAIKKLGSFALGNSPVSREKSHDRS